MDFDLVIKNGTILDGTGMPRKNMDLGIKGDKIELVDTQIPEKNFAILDAEGMMVVPGFVDMHSHSDFLWLIHPESSSKIYDGVTTEICGNCGLSAFPLRGAVLGKRSRGLERYGITITWRTAKEFYARAESEKSSINRAFLAGHGNIRACVIGYENRKPDEREMLDMKNDLEEAMNEGAYGLSSGLVYPPGCYAKTEELVELCKTVRNYGGLYTTHIRDEGDDVENALAEAIEIARTSGVKLQVSHLKTMGNRNWCKINTMKTIIENAIHEGLDVTCDRYPYIAAATDLDVVLPQWVYEGGTEVQVKRMKNRDIRKRIEQEVSSRCDSTFWNGIMISAVHSKKNKWMEGETISQIAKYLRKKPIETVLDVLIDENTRVDSFLFCMTEQNLEKILYWDFVFIGSDSSVRSNRGVLSKSKPHPRSYGTFSRILGKFCREKRLISEEVAVQKMTGLPAQKIGLDKRGLIKEGYYADITIFSPEKIIDKSTYLDPHQYSEGIEYVLVNGKITVRKGLHTGVMNGRILKNS
ncbi:MAG: D-aminoacylase [Candidatus Brocadiaceae bacterium]|nr:D-aminoacylase [Candidatus Brocadiaceae bacterium]